MEDLSLLDESMTFKSIINNVFNQFKLSENYIVIGKHCLGLYHYAADNKKTSIFLDDQVYLLKENISNHCRNDLVLFSELSWVSLTQVGSHHFGAKSIHSKFRYFMVIEIFQTVKNIVSKVYTFLNNRSYSGVSLTDIAVIEGDFINIYERLCIVDYLLENDYQQYVSVIISNISDVVDLIINLYGARSILNHSLAQFSYEFYWIKKTFFN